MPSSNHISQESIMQGVFDPETRSLRTVGGIKLPNFDYMALTQPDGVTDVYTFKVGGSGGTTVATLTIVYTDSTHATLSSITKT